VGAYQYHYNIETFNTPGINIWAFSLWVIGGYSYLTIHNAVKNKIFNSYLSLIISWAIYLTGLFVSEYIGYRILNIHENSARGGALIFGLIHGNKILHSYYLFFPALIIFLHQLLLKLPAWISKCFQNYHDTQVGTIHGRKQKREHMEYTQPAECI
jgi:hypothetical protein